MWECLKAISPSMYVLVNYFPDCHLLPDSCLSGVLVLEPEDIMLQNMKVEAAIRLNHLFVLTSSTQSSLAMASPLPASLTLEACPHPFHRQIICCQPDWSPETGYLPPKHVTHTYLRFTHAHICHTQTICILHIFKDPSKNSFTPHTFQHTHSHIHTPHTSPAHPSKTFPYTHKHSFMLTYTFISFHPYS